MILYQIPKYRVDPKKISPRGHTLAGRLKKNWDEDKDEDEDEDEKL